MIGSMEMEKGLVNCVDCPGPLKFLLWLLNLSLSEIRYNGDGGHKQLAR